MRHHYYVLSPKLDGIEAVNLTVNSSFRASVSQNIFYFNLNLDWNDLHRDALSVYTSTWVFIQVLYYDNYRTTFCGICIDITAFFDDIGLRVLIIATLLIHI